MVHQDTGLDAAQSGLDILLSQSALVKAWDADQLMRLKEPIARHGRHVQAMP